RLACPVRADDAAQLPGIDRKRECVERLEAIEAHADAVEIEHHAVRGGQLMVCNVADGGFAGAEAGDGTHGDFAHAALLRHRDRSPTTPCGRNNVTRMKIRPSAYSQYSGMTCVNTLFAP